MVKILIVGEKRLARVVADALHVGGYDPSLVYPTGAVALLAADERQLCVLAASNLAAAREFLDAARTQHVRAPIIVITDPAPRPETRRELMARGAIDALPIAAD